MTRKRTILVLGAAALALCLWLIAQAALESSSDIIEKLPRAEAAAADSSRQAGMDEARPVVGGGAAVLGDTGGSDAESFVESGELDRANLRFQVRWGESGFCGPKARSRTSARAALLATFVPLDGAAYPVLHDPSVDRNVLKDVQEGLDYAVREFPLRYLEAKPAPMTYVYKDVEQLQGVSCVNKATVGYYDGAIHVASDRRYTRWRIKETIVHEYMHHLLIERGVALPMWLHEGLAMQHAQEDWWKDSSLGLVDWLATRHIPFEAMTAAFPYTSDEKFALAVYYQSYMMVQFAQAGRRGDARMAALIEGLAQRKIRPAEAFTFATGLSGSELERAWSDFLAHRSAGPRRLLEAVEQSLQVSPDASQGVRSRVDVPATGLEPQPTHGAR